MPTGLDWFSRLSLAIAGILGAAGVGAAASASHAGDDRVLGALALVALTQAPALVALALLAGRWWLIRAAASLIGLGALMFCGDLASRHFGDGSALIPMLAPAGGIVLIGGWLLLVPAALVSRRE